MDLPIFLYPYYHSFGYSLSHQCSYFRWPTQETMSSPTTLRTMGRTTTKTPTRRHPLRLLLSKCWLCKHKCFRPCSRPWSTCMLNHNHCHDRGIGLDIFSAPSRQPFLKKLQVVQHNNHERVLLASHQLSGPVADLWNAYVEAHE
jgi:hypothetical protein